MDAPDILMTYEYVVLLTALFALSLKRPTGKHANSFDADDGVRSPESGADL